MIAVDIQIYEWILTRSKLKHIHLYKYKKSQTDKRQKNWRCGVCIRVRHPPPPPSPSTCRKLFCVFEFRRHFEFRTFVDRVGVSSNVGQGGGPKSHFLVGLLNTSRIKSISYSFYQYCELLCLSISSMNAEFVKDQNFPAGTRVQPGTKLTKKWIVRNSGTMPWASKTVVSINLHVAFNMKKNWPCTLLLQQWLCKQISLYINWNMLYLWIVAI